MSEFVEVKTADLVGAALDWAVAKVEGDKRIQTTRRQFGLNVPVKVVPGYSTNWNQTGPLISRYLMDFSCDHPETIGAALCDENGMYLDEHMAYGRTHLIAACRAIVASVLGETVSVPKELLS